MLVSLCFHGLAATADYASQIGLLLMTIVFPFVAPTRWRTIGMFAFVYGVWIVWGVWRFAFFDSVTGNDVPGMGYLVAPLLWCSIATVLFFIRKHFRFPRSKRI